MKVKRFQGNPILTPNLDWWDKLAVCNAAAVEHNGRVHLLYRAIGEDHTSRLGYAVSEDGYRFERSKLPIIEADGSDIYERFGIEDPRITKIDDVFYITYVAASVYPISHPKPDFAPGAPWRCRAGLLSTTDFRSFRRHGIILRDRDDKDVVLFPEMIRGRYAMLHRPFPNIAMAYSDDLLHWIDHQPIMSPRAGYWDCNRIGASAPPIKTERGWLEIYHGVDDEWRYHLGIVILDLEDPSRILARSRRPFLSPVEEYERVGLVPNVVFSCGAIDRDDHYLIYYGAADRVVCACSLEKEGLFDSPDLEWY